MAEGGVIGVQVLNEFTSVVRRKLSWDWTQVDAALAVISELMGPARPLTAEIHAHAVNWRATAHSHFTMRWLSPLPPTRVAAYSSPKTYSTAANSAA